MIAWRSEEWPFARFLKVSPAEFNPKDAEPEEIARLAEDYRVYGVGRSFAVRDDGLLLDGHQSLYAFGRLVRGEHVVDGEPVRWTPPATVQVQVAVGMSDTLARAFVAAVNARKVDVDPARYGALIRDLTDRVSAAADNDRATYQAAVAAIGLGPGELAGYLGQGKPERGTAQTKGAPRAVFEFTSAEVRDQVKERVAEANAKGRPAGDVLAKLLGIRVPRARREG